MKCGRQLTMFPEVAEVRPEWNGLARRTDPGSSKRAAVENERSGRGAAQREMVLSAVRSFPGRCSKDLARMTGLDRYVLARRLPELERVGVIKRGDSVGDLTWWIV